MENSDQKPILTQFEIRILTIGFILTGILIGIVAVSYLINSPFSIRWLVWLVGIAFGAVALLLIEWPRAFKRAFKSKREIVPKGRFRLFLLIAMPLAFILDSQICGLGLKACSTACNIISYSLIVLSIITAYRLHKDQPIGGIMIAIIVICVVPHCICEAPINEIWHNWIGFAPTCQVIPLATTLFSITALKGIRTRFSAAMALLLLVVTVFIAVGNPLWGFPWKGCTYLGH